MNWASTLKKQRELERQALSERYSSPKGYVYLIEAIGAGRYKIGWTKQHPSKRLKSLKKGSPPFPLYLVSFIYVEDCEKTEVALHSLFEDKRRHNEWFELTQDDLTHFESLKTMEAA